VGDAARLEFAAHALKGSAANFGPSATVEAARHLELLGRTAQLAQAREVLADLEEALQQFTAALAAVGRPPASPNPVAPYAATSSDGPAPREVGD
jgi:HPt (histidine-containing phosphotransfer) domain-containing protein